MKRVNCLYRVSSKQQLHEDDIPIQRAECGRYIETHSDWQFQKEYVEKAVSGFKTSVKDRGILQEILADAKNKTFDVLLVYMSDRIGRKEDESPVFVTTLNNLGIEVWTVTEGQLKTEEHIDKLLNYIRFWQAEGESRKTGMRVKDAQETNARAGKFIGGKAPIGYRLEYSGEISNKGRALKHLVIDKEAAQIVKKIYHYALHFNYGALKIAKVFNEEGIPGIHGEWKACTIMEILKNPVYMGHMTYNRRQRSVSGGAYERMPMENWILSEKQQEDLVIIPKEIWLKVQEMRENRKSRLKNGVENGHEKYPAQARGSLALMGLIYCGYCGCRLTNGSKYDYWTTKDGEKRKKIVGRYRCTNKANGSLSCGGKAYYRAEEIEAIVYSVIVSYLNSLKESDTYDELLKMRENQRKQLKQERDGIVKEIRDVGKDMETLRENIPAALRGEGLFSVEQLSGLMKEKEKRLKELNSLNEEKTKEYEQLQMKKKDLKSMGTIISDWGGLFMECSIPEKKVLLAKLIERIEVGTGSIKIRFKIREEDFVSDISMKVKFHTEFAGQYA